MVARICVQPICWVSPIENSRDMDLIIVGWYTAGAETDNSDGAQPNLLKTGGFVQALITRGSDLRQGPPHLADGLADAVLVFHHGQP